MIDLQNKRVTVMGLGLHGGALGTVQWLLAQGAKVTVTDLKTEKELAPTLEKLAGQNVELVLGRHRDEDFEHADLVVRNPGVPKNSAYLMKAQEAGVPIEMDSSLFFLHCPSKNIIGVTGSKGKTTTAKAITSVFEAGGKKVVEVGTDGISPLGSLTEITEDTIVVFELSSWRLEALEPHGISPHIAVVTNIYHEHLNTYDSLQEYIDAKKNIIRHQKPDDIAILNKDDDELATWEPDIHGTLMWYTHDDAPNTASLIGKHQRKNLVPAMLIGRLYGISDDVMSQAIAAIKPLAHRLELVVEKNGVAYINDSAATMPDATIAALETFKDKKLVLILGGSDKKLKFNELAEKIANANMRAIVWLPGTATKRMQSLIPTTTSRDTETMQDAVHISSELAQEGDVVLLSPGATSFGLFKHEFDRGEQFCTAVHQL